MAHRVAQSLQVAEPDEPAPASPVPRKAALRPMTLMVARYAARGLTEIARGGA